MMFLLYLIDEYGSQEIRHELEKVLRSKLQGLRVFCLEHQGS